MNDEQRFALHFGPFQTPLFNDGSVVTYEVRSEMQDGEHVVAFTFSSTVERENSVPRRW